MTVKTTPVSYTAQTNYEFYSGVGSPAKTVVKTTARPWSDSRNLIAHPGWKTKVANRQDATTAYSRTITEGLDQGSSVHLNGKFKNLSNGVIGYEIGSYQNGVPYNPPDRTSSSLRDIALAKLKAKLHKAVGDYNALVPLGELKDLRRLVRGSAELTHTLLSNIHRRLLRGSLRGAASTGFISWLGDAWLTWSFGINPMIMDIKSIANALDSYKDQDRFVRVTGTSSDKSVSSASNSTVIANLATTEGKFRVESELSYKYIAGADILIRTGNDYTLLGDHLHIFDPLSWVPTIYHLLPFSWLLDYFTTTGDFLDDLFWSFPGNTRFVSLNRRHVSRVTSQTKIVPKSTVPINNPVLSVVGHPSEWSYTVTRFERVVVGQLPYRSLRFRTADEITHNSITKLLNLASLIASWRR